MRFSNRRVGARLIDVDAISALPCQPSNPLNPCSHFRRGYIAIQRSVLASDPVNADEDAPDGGHSQGFRPDMRHRGHIPADIAGHLQFPLCLHHQVLPRSNLRA